MGQMKGESSRLQWLSVHLLRTQQTISPLDSGGNVAILACEGH